MGAKNHRLGLLLQAILYGGEGGHYPGIVGNLACLLVLGNVKVTPEIFVMLICVNLNNRYSGNVQIR